MAGLVPAISIHLAPPCPLYQDGRNTSGHDVRRRGSGLLRRYLSAYAPSRACHPRGAVKLDNGDEPASFPSFLPSFSKYMAIFAKLFARVPLAVLGNFKALDPGIVTGANSRAAPFCSRGRRPRSARKRLVLNDSSKRRQRGQRPRLQWLPGIVSRSRLGVAQFARAPGRRFSRRPGAFRFRPRRRGAR